MEYILQSVDRGIATNFEQRYLKQLQKHISESVMKDKDSFDGVWSVSVYTMDCESV